MDPVNKLIRCIGPYKKYAILTPIVTGLEVIVEILIPLIMARIIDVGIANGDISYIAQMGGLMVLMACLSLALGALGGRFAAVAATGLSKGIREAEFAKVQDFSFANLDRFGTASLITRLTTDVTNIENAFQMVIRILVRAPVMLVCATLMAIALNRKLAAVFLVAVPVLAIMLGLIISRAFPLFQKMLEKYDRLNEAVQETLTSIRVVKAYARGDYEQENFKDKAEELRKAQFKAEKLIVLNMPVMQFIMYGCMLAVMWFGGQMVIGGTFLTGELMSFFSYLSMVLMSLMMISMVFVMLVMSRASASRVVEVLETKTTLEDTHKGEDVPVKDGSVEFKNVSFSYSFEKKDNLNLKDVSFSVRSGETVGVIGGTGSAKSTLVQLIPRLYDVTGGAVFVGGRDVREYPLDTLRTEVAMVLQKNVLFSGTIRENLRWGDENATDEEIETACRHAAIHDFVVSLEDGYDTLLGQGGVNLSGGQKQRLCIARALLKKPKILILDDSTSAVDTATDQSIRNALATELPGITVFIIAQRIASVAEADKIIVLDEGRVLEMGNHEELMEKSAVYREVFLSQQKGVE